MTHLKEDTDQGLVSLNFARMNDPSDRGLQVEKRQGDMQLNN